MVDRWRQSKFNHHFTVYWFVFFFRKMLYPPSRAILRLRLNVGESSHANRPPGMVAERHMPNSPRTVVDAACSLNNIRVSQFVLCL